MRFLIHALAVALALAVPAAAQQQDFSQVEVKAEKVADKTRIIPGHGPLATKADLLAFRDTVKLLRDRIAKLKAEGKTRDAVIAAKPTADYDAKWGQGFIKPDVFTGLVFDSLP
jgi:glyoxylase-like metal-dependent hydrolase (beta-lactamase superfamily II)